APPIGPAGGASAPVRAHVRLVVARRVGQRTKRGTAHGVVAWLDDGAAATVTIRRAPENIHRNGDGGLALVNGPALNRLPIEYEWRGRSLENTQLAKQRILLEHG